jgi:hypothetical protein
MMTDKAIKGELKRFIDSTKTHGMYLIRETSLAYKCDRFLWKFEDIAEDSGRFCKAAYKHSKGEVILYGNYKKIDF